MLWPFLLEKGPGWVSAALPSSSLLATPALLTHSSLQRRGLDGAAGKGWFHDARCYRELREKILLVQDPDKQRTLVCAL